MKPLTDVRSISRVALSTIVTLILFFGALSGANGAEFFCPPRNVTCLIAAINQANGTPEEDTINLEPGVYTLTTIDNGAGPPPPFPINPGEGPNGLPLITTKIIVKGTAAQSTVIERDPAAPAFRLFQVAASGSLSFSGLTLQGGTALDFNFWGGVRDGHGGAVFNGGTLAVDHSILTNNSATGGHGGEGGAIFNTGAASIVNSSLDVNSTASNRVSFGGAIENGGTLAIISSSLAGNIAYAVGAGGGAIDNNATLTITNTTLAGNSVDAVLSIPRGGAIRNSGTLTIINSTLAGNFAGVKNSSGPPRGGGLYNESLANLQNTVVANNSIRGGSGPDCFGSVTSLDHSLIGDPTGCTVSSGSFNLTGDPGLGEFTDDGTPGNGHFPLLETSPAIDGGNELACRNNPLLTTDQIGNPRIGVCDIGAIEFSSVLIVALDVRPSSGENPINPNSKGVIPVAILSTKNFDASTVNQASLRFGPSQALPQGRGQLEDVNGDGLADLVLHFRTQDSGIQCGETSVSITGETIDGTSVEGSDSIRTVGCKATASDTPR